MMLITMSLDNVTSHHKLGFCVWPLKSENPDLVTLAIKPVQDVINVNLEIL